MPSTQTHLSLLQKSLPEADNPQITQRGGVSYPWPHSKESKRVNSNSSASLLQSYKWTSFRIVYNIINSRL